MNGFLFVLLLQVVLSLNHLQGAFLILLLGSGFGLLLLIFEFFFGRVLGMISAVRSASSDTYKCSGFYPFKQCAINDMKAEEPPGTSVTSGFDGKGSYVIRAVLKGS